jgi:DNA repair exonuclease SbcCD ATPase subunit
LAVTPTIQLTAHEALDLKLRGVAVHLAAGESRDEPASSGFSLELPGLLTLDVSTTTEIEESLAAAEEAKKAFDLALSERHVSSLEQAENRVQEKQQARSRVEYLDAQRADWLGDQSLDELRASANELSAKIAAIDSVLTGQILPDDETRLREELRAAESIIGEAQTALEEGAGEAAGLRVQINSITNDSRHISEQLEQNEAIIAEAMKSLQDAQAALGDEELKRQIQNDEQHLAEARVALQEIDNALQAADPETVAVLAENTKAALERQKQEIGDSLVAIGQLEGELAQARREGLFDRLSAVETELEGLTAEFRRVERRAQAAERLWKVLDAHRAAASRRYVRPLKDKIDTLGRLVFGPTFSVDIGADLSIENRSLDGISVPFDSLSGGAREQLGILARLAASQIVGQQTQVPLMMDDTLGFTDDDRLTRMGAAIASVARENQVIILTCMPSRFTYIGNATTVSL